MKPAKFTPGMTGGGGQSGVGGGVGDGDRESFMGHSEVDRPR